MNLAYASSISACTRMMVTSLVFFGLLSNIVLPPISFFNFSLYIVTIVSPLLFFLSFYLLIRSPFIYLNSFLPLILGFMVVLSAVISWTVGFSKPVLGDMLESVKYLQFFPYLLALSFLFCDSNLYLKIWLFYSGFLFLIIGYIQVFQIPFFTEFLLFRYLGADSFHLQNALSGQRVTLTGSDPNVGAVIAVFFLCYSLSCFLLYKNFLALVAAFLFLFLLFSTQSRTVLLAFVFSFGLYFLFFYRMLFVIKFFVFLLFVLSIIALVFYLDLKYLYLGVQYALEGKNNSLNVRLDNMHLAFDRFQVSPFFGMGPAKSEFSTIIDSEYALILQRYGLIGIFIFGFYVLYLLRLSRRNFYSEWGVTLFIFTVLSCVVMITNNIFSGYQLMSIIILLHIACVVEDRKNKSFKRSLNVTHLPPHVRSSAL